MALEETITEASTQLEASAGTLRELSSRQAAILQKYRQQIEAGIENEKPEGFDAAPFVLVGQIESPRIVGWRADYRLPPGHHGLLRKWEQHDAPRYDYHVRGHGLWLEGDPVKKTLSSQSDERIFSDHSQFPQEVSELLSDFQVVFWQGARPIYWRHIGTEGPKKRHFEVVTAKGADTPGRYTIEEITVKRRAVGSGDESDNPDSALGVLSPGYWLSQLTAGKVKDTLLKHTLSLPHATTPFDRNIWEYLRKFEAKPTEEVVLTGYGRPQIDKGRQREPWTVPFLGASFSAPLAGEDGYLNTLCEVLPLEDLLPEAAKLEILTNPENQSLYIEAVKVHSDRAVKRAIERKREEQLAPFTKVNLTYALAGRALLGHLSEQK